MIKSQEKHLRFSAALLLVSFASKKACHYQAPLNLSDKRSNSIPENRPLLTAPSTRTVCALATTGLIMPPLLRLSLTAHISAMKSTHRASIYTLHANLSDIFYDACFQRYIRSWQVGDISGK